MSLFYRDIPTQRQSTNTQTTEFRIEFSTRGEQARKSEKYEIAGEFHRTKYVSFESKISKKKRGRVWQHLYRQPYNLSQHICKETNKDLRSAPHLSLSLSLHRQLERSYRSTTAPPKPTAPYKHDGFRWRTRPDLVQVRSSVP